MDISEKLLNRIKLRLRKASTDVLDEDIKTLAEFAAADIERIGVPLGNITESDPLISEAIITYCNANYGNNPDNERLMNAYDMILSKIKISTK